MNHSHPEPVNLSPPLQYDYSVKKYRPHRCWTYFHNIIRKSQAYFLLLDCGFTFWPIILYHINQYKKHGDLPEDYRLAKISAALRKYFSSSALSPLTA
jgi:hypothetical protein